MNDRVLVTGMIAGIVQRLVHPMSPEAAQEIPDEPRIVDALLRRITVHSQHARGIYEHGNSKS